MNISGNSTYGSDGFAAYFGGNDIDTITKTGWPLTYIIPQIQNPNGNIITDTLAWTPITGTFVATGAEKHLILGNFKSDTATNKLFICPTNSPAIATDVCIDDVSCIDIDLPAFAGNDTTCIPGTTIYLGRQRDVGIDEDCIWYQLPNMNTALDTAAGIWVSPVVTTTYVVRQEVCAGIKWDTVVVRQDAVGLNELTYSAKDLRVFPIPAQEELILQWSLEKTTKEFTKAELVNSLGQVVKTIDLAYVDNKAGLFVKDLPDGVYLLQMKSSSGELLAKRFVIEH